MGNFLADTFFLDFLVIFLVSLGEGEFEMLSNDVFDLDMVVVGGGDGIMMLLSNLRDIISSSFGEEEEESSLLVSSDRVGLFLIILTSKVLVHSQSKGRAALFLLPLLW